MREECIFPTLELVALELLFPRLAADRLPLLREVIYDDTWCNRLCHTALLFCILLLNGLLPNRRSMLPISASVPALVYTSCNSSTEGSPLPQPLPGCNCSSAMIVDQHCLIFARSRLSGPASPVCHRSFLVRPSLIARQSGRGRIDESGFSPRIS